MISLRYVLYEAVQSVERKFHQLQFVDTYDCWQTRYHPFAHFQNSKEIFINMSTNYTVAQGSYEINLAFSGNPSQPFY